MIRWLDYDGCDNFRDLGGYPTPGGVTRWGVLYRSDALGKLTEADAGRVGAAVRTVVDLRTADEVGRLPLPSPLAERAASIAMDNPEIDAIRQAGAAGMGGLYLWNLDHKQDGFARLVRLLADPAKLPAVIQCNGGKDRTGICAALILDLLGVPDEKIIEDYVLTDEVRSRVPAEAYEQAVQSLVAAGLDPEILGARAETMAEFLTGFRDSWGSAEEYVAQAGVGTDTIASLRTNLVERHKP